MTERQYKWLFTLMQVFVVISFLIAWAPLTAIYDMYFADGSTGFFLYAIVIPYIVTVIILFGMMRIFRNEINTYVYDVIDHQTSTKEVRNRMVVLALLPIANTWAFVGMVVFFVLTVPHMFYKLLYNYCERNIFEDRNEFEPERYN